MKLFKKSFFISLFCFLPMVSVVSLFTEITLNVSTFLKHLFKFSGLFFGYFLLSSLLKLMKRKSKKVDLLFQMYVAIFQICYISVTPSK